MAILLLIDLTEMQLFNICAKKEFTSQGERKTKFYPVGVFKIADSGKKYINLFHMPQTDFYVFDGEKSLPIIE